MKNYLTKIKKLSSYLEGADGGELERMLQEIYGFGKDEISGGCEIFNNINIDLTPSSSENIFSQQLENFSSNNWRSSQPTLGQLKYLIEKKGIKRIIRLNGSNSGDTITDNQTGQLMTADLEEEFAECFGVEFYNISGHSGYQPGKGYVGTYSKTNNLINGNTFVHCKWGADRTGFVVASYLKANGETDLDKLYNYTIKFNQWEDYVCEGKNQGYAKYLDSFYPLDEWCDKEEHKDCPVCSKSTVEKVRKEKGTEKVNLESLEEVDIKEDLPNS